MRQIMKSWWIYRIPSQFSNEFIPLLNSPFFGFHVKSNWGSHSLFIFMRKIIDDTLKIMVTAISDGKNIHLISVTLSHCHDDGQNLERKKKHWPNVPKRREYNYNYNSNIMMVATT